MKPKMITFLIFVFILGMTSLVQAEEKTSDALGIKLGQVFDPAEAVGKAVLADGTPMYQFNPKKKFRSFTNYYVLITPKTHKVYAIYRLVFIMEIQN